jgi:hypothetical protein
MEFKYIPAGSIIYRARNILDKSEYTNPNKDPDTDKIGLYFSDAIELCQMMEIEYNQKLVICKYQITKPIKLFNGKYSFRNINPSRYFDENGNFIPNVDILESENINHYDLNMLPIIENANEYFQNIHMEFGEIFINNHDLEFVQFVCEL